MSTLADLLRRGTAGEISQSLADRARTFQQFMDVSPFMDYLNPSTRALVRENWFNPMSSRYLMATAPTSMGGYSGFAPGVDVEGPPPGSTFQEFLGVGPSASTFGPTTYAAGIPVGGPHEVGGATGIPTGGTYTAPGGAATMGANAFAPWSRNQWQSRFAGLGLPGVAAGGAYAAPAQGTDQREWLAALGEAEAQQMIRSATMAGLNPIMARAMDPSLRRAFAQRELASPEMTGGEMLHRFSQNWNPTEARTNFGFI
jgi:hypothetical protein